LVGATSIFDCGRVHRARGYDPVAARAPAKRGLDNAARAAGLNRDDVSKLEFHDLRHTLQAT